MSALRLRYPLLAKELRDQRPLIGFGLFFCAFDVIAAVTAGLDAWPLGRSYSSVNDEGATIASILGFAFGTGLLVREQDEGTLAFLEGLPITRGRLFLSKFAVAWAALMIFPTFSLTWRTALHLVARGSLDHAVYPSILVANWGLSGLLAATALSVGLWLGFFRSLAWFLLFALLSLRTWAARSVPALAALDPSEVTELKLLGVHPMLEPASFAGPAMVCAVSLTLSWAMFRRQPGRLRRALTGLSGRPVVSALVALVTAGAVFAWMYLQPRSSSDRTPEVGADPTFRSGAPGLRSTKHYIFHYPSTQAEAANAVAEWSDAVFEEVHTLLQVEPGAPIDVDLSGSMRNTAGTAFHERIRIELDAEVKDTLAHETTHVVARRLAKASRGNNLEQLKLFNEGLAEWVGRRYGDADTLAGERLVAAALFDRGEVNTEELFDWDTLARLRDEQVQYPLGATLIDVLVERHGADAPRKVLEQLASPRLRTDLKGHALYQVAFQLAGFDLSLVVDDFFRRLAADRKALSVQLATLPRARAELFQAPGWYGVRPAFDRPLPRGWSVVVRFRSGPQAMLRDYDHEVPEPGQPAWREAGEIARGELCFQLGIRAMKSTLYEPWECLPVSSAVEWNEASAKH